MPTKQNNPLNEEPLRQIEKIVKDAWGYATEVTIEFSIGSIRLAINAEYTKPSKYIQEDNDAN